MLPPTGTNQIKSSKFKALKTGHNKASSLPENNISLKNFTFLELIEKEIGLLLLYLYQQTFSLLSFETKAGTQGRVFSSHFNRILNK